jgi:hypothetical protein
MGRGPAGRSRALDDRNGGWDRSGRNARGAPPPRRSNAHRTLWIATAAIVLLLLPTIGVIALWPRLHGAAADALFPWATSAQRTAANAADDAFASQQDAVDPAFQAYYSAHAGATELGTPLTPAFLTSAGTVQVYASGALLLPAAPPAKVSVTPTANAKTPAPTPGDAVLQLLGYDAGGAKGAAPKTADGVARLPVVAGLLQVGSQIALGSSTLTYLDLRKASGPDQTVSGTAPATLPATTTQPVFISLGKSNGRLRGHNIPADLWNYINRTDISPGSWQSDVGLPMTEALTTTAAMNGATHHLTVQAFWQAVLVEDSDAPGADGKPTITRLSIGQDYLHTVGPPSVVIPPNTSAWVTADTTGLDAPVTGNAKAHIGQNFPVTLTGQFNWTKATLWYGASWGGASSGSSNAGTPNAGTPSTTPSAGSGTAAGQGWLPGAAITFTTPDPSQPAHAGFDVLSADLAAYMANQGSTMGVAVYDMTRNTYYGYNDSKPFYLASTAKVYIMCSYLDWLEGQGRGPNSNEMYLLTTMIENSNNDSAQALFDTEGHMAGQQRFLQKIGINSYIGYGDFWGWAQLPPSAATTVLTLLLQGKILNDSDRKLAFNLMGNIEPDQRMGIGVTAPTGAIYYMKDGWVQVPDNSWALNSTGIVTVGKETYIIAVYSRNPNYDWSAVEHVCGQIGKLLTS